jgi:hypothetical protein
MIFHTLEVKVCMIRNERTLKARGVYDIQRKDTLALQDV